MRERIGPVASFKTAVVVERLPKTRSGKILRGTMRRIADGEEYTVPATIDDPAILEEMQEALTRHRLPAPSSPLSWVVSLTQYYTATTLDGFIADPDNSLEWLFKREQRP